MAERVAIGYRRLFEVRLLHHYWLDEGPTVFDALPAPARSQRLLTYDVRPLLAIAPTAATERALQGLRGVFRRTSLGWVVAVPQDALIADETKFDFVLTARSADFFNYTALTLPSRGICELADPARNTRYRYKENVPVWSNLTGAARGVGADRALFLSQEIPPPAATDQVEALVAAGGALVQLTGDEPGAATQQLSAHVADAPVFVSQADVPAIVPPAGLAGAPARGILLTPDIADEVLALVRIAAVRPGEADFSCTSAGRAKAQPPVFQVRFKNRSTTWRYFDQNTGALVATEPAPLPLTRFGNAGTRRKPAGGLIKVAFDAAVPTKITGIFSDIFE